MLFVRKPLLLYLLILVGLQALVCVLSWRQAQAGTVDFRNFYADGYMVRTGQAQHLYDYAAQVQLQSEIVSPGTTALPLMVPPCVALAFAPLSLLRFIPAYIVFAVLNVLLLGAALRLLHPYVPAVSDYAPATPLLFFLGFPFVGFALAQGQLSVVLLAAYCAAFAALQRGKDVLAGLLLSIGLIKLQIALPVAALFLIWRQWRFVLGFIAGAIVFVSSCVATLRNATFADVLRSMFSTSSIPSSAEQLRYGIYPEQMPNLYGLFYRLLGAGRWSIVATVLASVILFAWAARRPRSLPFAITIALLVSYHLYAHDLLLLLLPFSILLNDYLAAASTQAAPNDIVARGQQPGRESVLLKWAFGSYVVLAPLAIFLIGWKWTCIFTIPTLLAAFALAGEGHHRRLTFINTTSRTAITHP